MMRLIAISRDKRFSKSDADTAILNAVINCLEQQGHEIVLMSEKEFQESGGEGDLVFGMYRDEKTLSMLDELQQHGIPAIPSPQAVRNAQRNCHVDMLMNAGIPMPPTGNVGFPCWLKKSNGWTESPTDVIFCEHEFPANLNLNGYLIQKHIDGDLFKFYGVLNTDFFYPSDNKHLLELAIQAAEVLSLPIFGGDAIVTSDGSIYIIDFNDWPSFSPCREEAAKAIAQRILKVNRK